MSFLTIAIEFAQYIMQIFWCNVCARVYAFYYSNIIRVSIISVQWQRFDTKLDTFDEMIVKLKNRFVQRLFNMITCWKVVDTGATTIDAVNALSPPPEVKLNLSISSSVAYIQSRKVSLNARRCYGVAIATTTARATCREVSSDLFENQRGII